MNDLPYPSAVVDGFEIGMLVRNGDCGDAWVIAPDGSACSLIWETGEPTSFEVSIPAEPGGRWGTFAVRLPLPLTTDSEAVDYLAALLPKLTTHWRAWAAS